MKVSILPYEEQEERIASTKTGIEDYRGQIVARTERCFPGYSDDECAPCREDKAGIEDDLDAPGEGAVNLPPPAWVPKGERV